MRRFLFISIISVLIGFNSYSQDDPFNDPIPDVTYEVMQDRMSCIEQTIPLIFNERVQSFVDYFTVRDRSYTKEVISRRDFFFPIFEETLAKYGMPDELKYLSIIESGLRPNAVSRVGAGGLWQFMPSTGRAYGLKQTWYIDERMNPWKSTEAACKYLKQLYGMFGDWELALAAYNTGPGNVRKAIRRSGYKDTFWEVYRYLPRETRSYVPQFVAMIYTLNYVDEHYFDMEEIEMLSPVSYDTIQVSNYMHMKTLVDQIDLCLEDLVMLNPQLIRGAIPKGTIKYPLKIPSDLIDTVRKNRIVLLDSASKVGKKELEALAKNTPGSVYGRNRQIHRVRSGEVLGTIAERYHVRVSDLRRWNNISGNMIYAGQKLNVWVLPHFSAKAKTKSYSKPKPKPAPLIAPNGTYHIVQSGDSLWSIANKYQNVSIEQLKKLNNLSGSRIDPGQRLLINM
ncbi:MAG: transglycosylase SLT domain-containing protein [Reichenbachiella sp.]